MASTAKAKRTALSLYDRVNVVERNERGESCLAIARSLGVGKTQIQSIIEEKEAVKRRWENGESGERKTSKILKTVLTAIDD